MARSGSNKRKRTEQETVRLTLDERAELCARAARAGLKKPAYIRQQCLEQAPARQMRSATPTDALRAQILLHVAAATDANKAGRPDDVQREHMMIRHLLCIASGGTS